MQPIEGNVRFLKVDNKRAGFPRTSAAIADMSHGAQRQRVGWHPEGLAKRPRKLDTFVI